MVVCVCALPLCAARRPQLRAIAEAAMHELQSKVKDREAALAQLTAKLQEHQAAYLEQHARDRAEIEALNNKLFESGAASIAGVACVAVAIAEGSPHQVCGRQGCCMQSARHAHVALTVPAALPLAQA
jgi:hypothetical protein